MVAPRGRRFFEWGAQVYNARGPPMPPLSHETVVDNRYELAEHAEGLGHGTCWKARDRWDRLRARLLRILSPVGPGVAPPEAQLRALQTVRHPSVLPLLHHGVWQSSPYLVQEWFDGLSLERLFALDPALRGEVSVAAARGIADQILSALEAALNASPQLAHGALDAGQVLVLDVHSRRPEVRVVGFCTAAWEARAAEVTPLDDARALARLLRAMLSPSPGRWREGTPAGVIAWIERCSSPALAAQGTSAAALRDALRAAWTDAPAPAAAPVPSEQPPAAFEAPAPMEPPPPQPPARAADAPAPPPSFATDELDEATLLTANVQDPSPTSPAARRMLDGSTSEESTTVQRALSFAPTEEESTDVTRHVGAPVRALRPISHVGDPEHPGDVTVQRTSLKHLGPPRAPDVSAAASDAGDSTTPRTPSPRPAPTPIHTPERGAPYSALPLADETLRAPLTPPQAPGNGPWRAEAPPQEMTAPSVVGWPTTSPGAPSPLVAPPRPQRSSRGGKVWVVAAVLVLLVAALIVWWLRR